MKNRVLRVTNGKDQTLRDLINNTGINDFRDIPVSKVIYKHKPVDMQALILLLNATGTMTLRQRVNKLWSAVETLVGDRPEFASLDIDIEDCKRMVKQVLVLDSWLGFDMERQAVAAVGSHFTGYTMYSHTLLDSKYSVDFAVMTSTSGVATPNGKESVVLGIQVKPLNYKFTSPTSTWGSHKALDHQRQAAFRDRTGAETVDLYYSKETMAFTNLDEVIDRVNQAISGTTAIGK
ncbi:hypothetical protein I2I05_08625 [Hymenobacter sp. BT683]|uniref:Uncharacterized protein n=1 Tax=Hymenobacter jeongseonensis TaxID=2791027 RepID=A0ABS0IGH9_9BACT|nr:hypothetical protein [Hymenobacter jeongseonensis]MBF9237461.1 hypothetical protein [Hymenobacter jeongseonensis]